MSPTQTAKLWCLQAAPRVLASENKGTDRRRNARVSPFKNGKAKRPCPPPPPLPLLCVRAFKALQGPRTGTVVTPQPLKSHWAYIMVLFGRVECARKLELAGQGLVARPSRSMSLLCRQERADSVGWGEVGGR